MRKLSVRLKHLAQEHQAVMHFISAMRQVRPESETDLPEVAKRVRQVFASDLEPHFVEEERYALPLLREAGHEALADEVFSQHEKMRAMDKALEHPTATMLVDFVHMLEKHVELEENEVWDVLAIALAEQDPGAAQNA
ncbi:MAG: hemerythrin domain-containing protein [Uliginosibacterium sp.]|nr:hemerythrin domain-containing protein [Uliginosibacterium sp.]